jgi:hypothetical protein
MMAWQKGVHQTRVRGEKGPEWRDVAGYSDGTFGLDKRRYLDEETGSYRDGYCVVHLATGYAVRYVRGTLAQAKVFADALHAADCWSFTDPAKSMADPRRSLVTKAACEVAPTSDGFMFDPPTYVDAA